MSDTKGLFGKIKKELFKTRQGPISGIKKIFSKGKLTERELEELEETLILSDVGVKTTMQIVSSIREDIKGSKEQDPETILKKMKKEMVGIIMKNHSLFSVTDEVPFVILIVGVNGSGKTTTIGKLANRLIGQGKKVLVAAGDTFRAAAVEQLAEWCERCGADILRAAGNPPPSAVVYDAVQAAKARGHDVLIIDTAGRLHTKTNLMDELKKINRVIKKELPHAPHETLLVLDAITGQNALSQIQFFHESVPLTGMVLTKLDGTAKGGVILNLMNEFNLPVKLIGFGESMGDLEDFNPEAFVEGLFEDSA